MFPSKSDMYPREMNHSRENMEPYRAPSVSYENDMGSPVYHHYDPLNLPRTEERSTFKVMIEYGGNSDILIVTSYEDLRNQVGDLHHVTEFKLEIHDSEFNRYRNMKRADLCNHCVLRLVELDRDSRSFLSPLRNSQNPPPLKYQTPVRVSEPDILEETLRALLPTSSGASNLDDNQQLNSPEPSQAIDLTPVGLSGAIAQRSTSPPPVLKPRALSRELPLPSAGPVRSKDWYKTYVVRREIFPDSVTRQLSEEVEMATCEQLQRAVNSALYNDVTRFTYKFPKYSYEAIIKSLCKLHPYLKGPRDPLTGKYKLSKVYKFSLKNSFQYYVQNQKKRGSRDEPEVSAARSVYLAKRKGTPIVFNNIVSNHWGIPNFCPNRVEGETDKSIAERIEQMELISRQLPCNRNTAIVHDMMEKTFPERRVLVTQRESLKTIPEMQAIYPLLFNTQAVSEEYKMLMKKELLPGFYQALTQLEEKVLGLPTKKESRMVEELRILITDTEDPMRRSYLKKVASIFVIVGLLKENPEDLFLKPGTRSAHPQIFSATELQFVGPQRFGVYVEGVEMADSGEFLDAVALMFAGYYIFNIQFVKLKSTLAFFARCVFGINDQTVKDGKVAKLRAKLKV